MIDRRRQRSSVFSWITTVSAPSGTGAPVKMRTASPLANSAREAAARRRDANQPEPRRKGGHVGRAHRVTIHGGGIERRLGEPRREVPASTRPRACLERHALGLERVKPVQHAGESFSDRQQSHQRLKRA